MDSIIRGTNAAIRIKITDDVDISEMTAAELHIFQCGREIVKHMQDLSIEANTVSYRMTQEETLKLMPGPAEITLIGMLGEDRFETRPVVSVEVENTRKNEVMT